MKCDKTRCVFFVFMVLITGVACSTAIRIEILNARVGGFLPRPQPPSVEGNNVKWRVAARTTVERIYKQQVLHERGIDYSDEALDTLVLTPRELRELEEQQRLARLDARFRSVVSSLGLLQYLLIPVGLVLCVVVFPDTGRTYRAGALVCGALLIVCGGLMLYREYLPSLGW